MLTIGPGRDAMSLDAAPAAQAQEQPRPMNVRTNPTYGHSAGVARPSASIAAKWLTGVGLDCTSMHTDNSAHYAKFRTPRPEGSTT
jgi:hypothetical protein